MSEAIKIIREAGGKAGPMSRATGVVRQVADQWLHGARPLPPQHIDAIAELLGIEAVELHYAAARDRGFRV